MKKIVINARPRGRPPAEKPKTANRYSVNFTDEENNDITTAANAAGDEFLGRWIGNAALAWARGVGWMIYVSTSETNLQGVRAFFPGYKVQLSDALDDGEVKIGDGPTINLREITQQSTYQRGLKSIDDHINRKKL
jgi:hypothetical protein